MTVCKVKLLSDVARMPTYAKPGDSGADLYAAEQTRFAPGDTKLVPLDIAIELAPGYEAQFRPRSSMSRAGWLTHFGTVDTGYRGALQVCLTNITGTHMIVHKGDRIAQLVVAPVVQAAFEVTNILSSSERGTSGWGSTGR